MRKFRAYRALPVGGKLQLIGLFSLVVSIALSTLWLLANDYKMSNALVRESIETEARIVADNVAVPLHFGDEQAAAETLAALRASPAVLSAQLVLVGGRLFADYQGSSDQEITVDAAHLKVPVRLKERELGELRIDYDVSSFAAQWLQKAAVAVAVALLAVLAAFFMMRRLLSDIVSPISQLSALMESVALSQDYSLRSGLRRDDELGQLAHRLDQMLATIAAYREEELRRSEMRLSESEERFNKLVESVPVGVVQLDETGGLVFANRMFGQLAGAGRKAGLEFVHPESRGEISRVFDAVLAGGHKPAAEIRLMDRAGAEVWVLIEANPLSVIDGKARGAVATLLDVTERRQKDAELRLAAIVFEASHEAIMITDGDGTIVSVNRAFTRITEYEASEVVGRSPALFAAGTVDEFEASWKTLVSGEAWSGEGLSRRKGGETYPTWTSVTTVRGGDGRIANVVFVSRDITGQKEENERIRYLAHYDGLTGLPNRTLFYDRAQREVLRCRREGGEFALLYLDLNRFKWVNDSLGHAVGDAMLIEVAHRLKAAVRDSDTVSRFGGDEFVILLTDIGEDAVAQLIERLLATVNGEVECLGHRLRIEASLGASYGQRGRDDIEHLVAEADRVMYEAKRATAETASA